MSYKLIRFPSVLGFSERKQIHNNFRISRYFSVINFQNGDPFTDPGVGDELGGYKGYSWSVVVELLSIAFQNGDFGPQLTGVDAQGWEVWEVVGTMGLRFSTDLAVFLGLILQPFFRVPRFGTARS